MYGGKNRLATWIRARKTTAAIMVPRPAFSTRRVSPARSFPAPGREKVVGCRVRVSGGSSSRSCCAKEFSLAPVVSPVDGPRSGLEVEGLGIGNPLQSSLLDYEFQVPLNTRDVVIGQRV